MSRPLQEMHATMWQAMCFYCSFSFFLLDLSPELVSGLEFSLRKTFLQYFKETIYKAKVSQGVEKAPE